MDSLAFTAEEVDRYFGGQTPALETLVDSVYSASERFLFPGTMGGQPPLESLTQYFNTRFLPYARAQAQKGRQDAQAVLAILDEKSAEVTSSSVAVLATLATRMMEGPNLPERQAVIGLAAVLLMIGLKAKKNELKSQ